MLRLENKIRNLSVIIWQIIWLKDMHNNKLNGFSIKNIFLKLYRLCLVNFALSIQK